MPALFIVTGTTRGLGAAFAELAVRGGHRVIGLSRALAADGETVLTDLRQLDTLPSLMTEVLAGIDLSRYDFVVLINNAAVIGPIGDSGDPSEIAAHVTINLTAPMLLSRAFVTALRDHPGRKRLIHLSSGASSTAFAGWSAYCASKAGLDHFGRCLALEQVDAAHPVDVLGFSPGVVDTGMQADIRASNPEDFPQHARFVALHADAQLAAAEDVARVLLAAALSERRYQGAVLRASELP